MVHPIPIESIDFIILELREILKTKHFISTFYLKLCFGNPAKLDWQKYIDYDELFVCLLFFYCLQT